MKIIIIEPCLVNHGDDRGGVHESAGALLPDVPKDVARQLVAVNRALYVSKADDPDKGGKSTATREMIAAAEDMARAAGKSRKSEA